MSLSQYFKGLPAPVQRSSLAVKGLQRQRVAIQHEYSMACIALEKQFLAKQQALNHRRLALITGDKPTSIELSAGKEDTIEDDEDYKAPSLNPNDTAPIPDFWLTVIRNHVELDTMVEDHDVPALKRLVDIRFSFLYPTGPKPDYKLEFRFKANDFFTNNVLEKTYYYKEESDKFGDFEPDRSVGTNIRWKPGRKLTSDDESSFFDFFTPPVRPWQFNQRRHGNRDNSEDEDDELEMYEEELEEDFTMGETFKDEVIPDAIDYYMQEKEEDDEDFDWDSDLEDENSNKDSNDDDSDDDDDDDDDDSNDDSNDDDEDGGGVNQYSKYRSRNRQR